MVEPLKIKHHSLTGRINLKLMQEAFHAVKRNKGTDISGFFDCIPHDVVLRGLTNVVADGDILTLVERTDRPQP